MAESPVRKAILLLKQLAQFGEPTGVEQLARAVGLNVSTVHRLLQVLLREDMVSYDPGTRLYGIGADCIGFATQVLGSHSPLERIRPLVHDLAQRLRETCAFGVYEPRTFTKAITLVERGPQPLGYDFEVGRRDGIHAGASGKAILAALPDADIERMFETMALAPATARTITNVDELHRQIEDIRVRGYATSHGERIPGAGFGIAAAVYGMGGAVTGSIVATIPLFRWRGGDLADVSLAVMECGRNLSTLLHGQFSVEPPDQAPHRATGPDR